MKTPLQNLKILITRSRIGPGKLKIALEKLGANVYELKTLQHTKNDCYQLFIQLVKEIDQYDVIILSSTRAYNLFIDCIRLANIKFNKIYSKKILVIGDIDLDYISTSPFKVDITKPEILKTVDIEDIKRFIAPFSKILYIKADVDRSKLLEQLYTKSALLKEVSFFNTKECTYDKAFQEKLFSTIDLIIFPSSINAERFFKIINKDLYLRYKHIKTACMGNKTKEILQKNGINMDIISPDPSMDSFINTIISYYTNNH